MDKQIKLRNIEKPTWWQLSLKLLFVAYISYKAFFAEHLEKDIFNEQPYKTVITLFFIVYLGTFITDFFKLLKQDKVSKIALTLNEKGITELLQFKELGIIPWEDIEFVGLKNKFWSQHLIIKVKNPLEYINKVSANFKLKKLLRENNAKHQTPIVININELDMPSDKLRDLVKNKWNKHKLQ
ncbi:MAG: STM3941 family protein [Flavobacteriaceae bacterium]|nr:STM3941 family protein [Flavobacteriaceae bacterium]